MNAAKAMVWKHPSYYFVVDRDEKSDTFVERSWAQFPDPDTYNLLVWRKRELENYFLDPDYLVKSNYLKRSPDELRERIAAEAQRRFYMDAANLVLLDIRSKLLKPAEAGFRDPAQFPDQPAALTLLKTCAGLTTREAELTSALDPSSRETRLNHWIRELSGGILPLRFGDGRWLDLMSGKELFHAIANWAFIVRDATGQLVEGKDKNKEVAKGLLRKPLAEQPHDFQALVEVVRARLTS